MNIVLIMWQKWRMPKSIVERAKLIMKRLEKSHAFTKLVLKK